MQVAEVAGLDQQEPAFLLQRGAGPSRHVVVHGVAPRLDDVLFELIQGAILLGPRRTTTGPNTWLEGIEPGASGLSL